MDFRDAEGIRPYIPWGFELLMKEFIPGARLSRVSIAAALSRTDVLPCAE